MTPRKENIPLTIDANYVVGFNYLRQWQIRGVVDVAPGIALGVSAENPAAIFVGSTATAPLGTGGAFASGGIVNGQVVNFVNTGGGGDFLQNVNVTTDQAPDIIEKASFDPGWGHQPISLAPVYAGFSRGWTKAGQGNFAYACFHVHHPPSVSFFIASRAMRLRSAAWV